MPKALLPRGLNAYMHIHMNTKTHTYMHIHMNTKTHTYLHIHMNTKIHTYMHIRMNTKIPVLNAKIPVASRFECRESERTSERESERARKQESKRAREQASERERERQAGGLAVGVRGGCRRRELVTIRCGRHHVVGCRRRERTARRGMWASRGST